MSGTRRLAVLVVEDNPGDARLIRETLGEFAVGEFELDDAETLADALRRPPGAYDAVLVDLSLPDSSGLANVAAVARHFGDAAIAVLTGRNEASLAAAAVRAGAQDYIVKGEVGGPALVDVVRRAIKLRREADAERREARERAQREFIANVSHEFRTPIAAIKGAAETLAEGSLDGPGRAEFLDIIARHTTRLERLVDAVLMLASLDAAGAGLAVADVELRPAADACLSGLAPLAARDGLTLANDVPAGLFVRADPQKLDRVLESLCANAVEYNKPGGSVRVSARVSGSEAEISVEDTGMGVPAADLPLLFERFHRSAAARGRQSAGTGLGLMIVKRLVEAHGGSVWAESRDGLGSTFRFTLPRAQ